MAPQAEPKETSKPPTAGPLPSLSPPKGGGALHGMGDKFSANLATGAGSLAIPLFVSPGRSGFQPDRKLQYDSGSGNGPYGMGFGLNIPRIARRTDKGLPRYLDQAETDIFVLSGAEDLVPALVEQAGTWVPEK